MFNFLAIPIAKVKWLRRRFMTLRPSLGWHGALHYICQESRMQRMSPGVKYKLLSKNSSVPLQCRLGTSDIDVFGQIFIDLEYSCLNDVKNVGLIVDCGANVGYSSAYFLTRFRHSKVICVEPDSSNYAMLNENLKPYSNRVELLHAGIWSHLTELRISKEVYRDGKEWAVQVEECGPGEKGQIRAVDIGSILAKSGYDRISILKIDIEGAEAVVFAGNVDSWISRVDNLVIELHDDSTFGPASELVISTMSKYGNFEVSNSGELTVFKVIHVPVETS